MAASLDDLIKISTTPVFVDFWAAWCGPCKTVAPSVKKLADEFKGRLMVVKVNVDEQPSAASRFQVQGIPALMLFKDGEKKWSAAGALPYPQLKVEVEKALR
ncbi:MAG: thioredoxin [Candidatus Chlorobium antarcticum]|jgi:thioredoxin|nr:thioredoxin [Candidatus Chlorobium antarcticum]